MDKEPMDEKEAFRQTGAARSGDRQLWLDVLRTAAACAVVMMHTLTGAVDILNTAAYPQGKQMLIVMDLVTWCVPVFLMISGYLFLNPQKQIPFGKMVRRYCLRIVLALLIFGIPFSCLELIAAERGFRVGMLWEGVWMVLTMRSWSHMWYLYLILLLYFLTPAMKWLLQRLPQAVILLFMAILLTGGSLLPFWNKASGSCVPVLPDGTIYLFYYLYGYRLWIRKGREDKKEAVIWGCAAAAALIGMTCSRLGSWKQLQMAYNYPPTVLLSVALMHFARTAHALTGHELMTHELTPHGPTAHAITANGLRSRKKSPRSDENGMRPGTVLSQRIRSKITEFAAMSFCIYLIHPVFLNVFYKALHITPLNAPFLPALCGFFAVVLCLSVFGAWLLRKLTPLRKYVL